MYTVAISPELRKYLLVRGIDLDAPLDECPATEEFFIPTPEDEAELVAWRAECEARERDEEEARRYCEYVEIREREHRGY